MRTKAMIVALAATLAGCGGGDPPSGKRATRPAAAPSYISKADAICREANEKETALGAEGPGWMYSEQFDDPEFLADFTAIGHATRRKLEALTPPAADRDKATAMLASIDRMLGAIDARVKDLRAGRTDKTSKHLNEYESAYVDLAVAAGPLGVSECQGLLL